MAVEIDTVLVPVDGTDEAEHAVEYALAIGERYDATVHVLHVLDESVARAVREGAVDADAVADDHRSFMRTIRQSYEAAGSVVPLTQSVVLGFSSKQLTRNPVRVVLDTADEIGADFIVVPRESVHEHPTAMLGKVAQHVLSYASQPVLSV